MLYLNLKRTFILFSIVIIGNGVFGQEVLKFYADKEGKEVVDDFYVDICGEDQKIYIRIDLREARKYDRIQVFVYKRDSTDDRWEASGNYNTIDPHLSETADQRYLYIMPNGIAFNSSYTPICKYYESWLPRIGKVKVVGQKKDGTETYYDDYTETIRTRNLYKFDKNLAESPEFRYQLTQEQIAQIKKEEADAEALRLRTAEANTLADSVKTAYTKDLKGVPIPGIGFFINIIIGLSSDAKYVNRIGEAYSIVAKQYIKEERFEAFDQISNHLLAANYSKKAMRALCEKLREIPDDTESEADAIYETIMEYQPIE